MARRNNGIEPVPAEPLFNGRIGATEGIKRGLRKIGAKVTAWVVDGPPHDLVRAEPVVSLTAAESSPLESARLHGRHLVELLNTGVSHFSQEFRQTYDAQQEALRQSRAHKAG